MHIVIFGVCKGTCEVVLQLLEHLVAKQAKSFDCWFTLTIRSFISCAEQCQVGLVVPVTTQELSTLSIDLLMDAMLPSQVVAISI